MSSSEESDQDQWSSGSEDSESDRSGSSADGSEGSDDCDESEEGSSDDASSSGDESSDSGSESGSDDASSDDSDGSGGSSDEDSASDGDSDSGRSSQEEEKRPSREAGKKSKQKKVNISLTFDEKGNIIAQKMTTDDEDSKRDDAATKIQAAWRGHQQRQQTQSRLSNIGGHERGPWTPEMQRKIQAAMEILLAEDSYDPDPSLSPAHAVSPWGGTMYPQTSLSDRTLPLEPPPLSHHPRISLPSRAPLSSSRNKHSAASHRQFMPSYHSR